MLKSNEFWKAWAGEVVRDTLERLPLLMMARHHLQLSGRKMKLMAVCSVRLLGVLIWDAVQGMLNT